MHQYYLQVANEQFEISTVEDNEQSWIQILRMVSPILNVRLTGHTIYWNHAKCSFQQTTRRKRGDLSASRAKKN